MQSQLVCSENKYKCSLEEVTQSTSWRVFEDAQQAAKRPLGRIILGMWKGVNDTMPSVGKNVDLATGPRSDRFGALLQDY